MNTDKQYLIHGDDYFQHISEKLTLYSLLRRCTILAKKLPDTKCNSRLKHFAAQCDERCDALLGSWGIPSDAIGGDGFDNYTELLEQELISPEDAGYISLDELERYANGAADSELDSEADSEDDDNIISILLSLSQCLTDCAGHILSIVSEGLYSDE